MADAIKVLAARIEGVCAALMHAIHVLQSQPGYDHDAFVAMIAALDVAQEELAERRPPSMSPDAKRAFDETVKAFLTRPPVLPEAWIQRQPKPDAQG